MPLRQVFVPGHGQEAGVDGIVDAEELAVVLVHVHDDILGPGEGVLLVEGELQASF